MNIGILTFYSAKNIGAQLQALALSLVLKNMGHQVSFVRYEPDYLIKPYSFFRNVHSKNGLLSCIKQVLLHVSFDTFTWLKTVCHYRKFQTEYFSITLGEYNEPSDLKKSAFDAIIVGSDQVWNPEITNNRIDSMYTLDSSLPGIRKISYAASFSESHITKTEIATLVERLNDFSKISVREKHLEDLLSSYVRKPIEVVVDPTLLMPKEEWLKIIPKSRLVRKKYVLVYQARGCKSDVLSEAKKLAREIHAEIIDASGMNYRIRKNGMQYVNPIEFLNLVYHAEVIVTASFHGTALSLILEKPFYSIRLDDGRDGRVYNLLESVGLLNRMVRKNETIINEEIDYSSVRQKLKALRISSVNFLNEALK